MVAGTHAWPLVPGRRGVDAKIVKARAEITLTGSGLGTRETVERAPVRISLMGDHEQRCRTLTGEVGHTMSRVAGHPCPDLSQQCRQIGHSDIVRMI